MKQQYRGIIIAGHGAVGRAVLSLGATLLGSFEEVVVIDQRAVPKSSQFSEIGRYLVGDITDLTFLRAQLRSIAKPALFINLTAGVDNVRIREEVGGHEVAYIDSCCCAPDGSDEVRFSRMMSYTLTPVKCLRPQWLCWGINPGLVELVARRIITSFQDSELGFDVTVYENDQLVSSDESRVAVGWCPDALIEEIMQSPTLQFIEGRPDEEKEEGARRVVACWDGEPVHSRLVGHEDIWNIGRLPQVRNASFVYGLHPRVMKIFDGRIDTARESLYVPEPQKEVFGRERVAVAVRSRLTKDERVLVWEEDHHRIWERCHINAVQYQTGKAILLAITLLRHSRYGGLAGTYCAADLPVLPDDWRIIEQCMRDLSINFAIADDLGLRLCGCISSDNSIEAGIECCCQ
jgi:hypothetical protein